MFMKKEILENINRMLLFKQRELGSAACRTVSDLKADAGKLADPLDQAVVEFNLQMELSIRGREISVLQDIQQALLRIDQGIFGVCEHCGQSIAEKRLLARPITLLCLDCQHRQEIGSGIVTRWAFRDGQTVCSVAYGD